MNISDIETIVTVVQENSFTKAARKLFVSQSAVSQTVARVEKELGVSLFVRNNNQLFATEACNQFHEKGKQILKIYDEIFSEIGALGNNKRSLRVGTVSFFIKYLSHLSESFDKKHLFDFDVNIYESHAPDIEKKTMDGKLDFCFTRLPLQEDTLEYEHLFKERILLAVPINHPICAQHEATPECPYPFINLSDFMNDHFAMIDNARVTPVCMSMCKEAGFTPKIVYSTYTWEHIYAYIKSTNAVGFISILHADKTQKDIRFFQIESPYEGMEHVVAYISRKMLSSDSRKFINTVRNYIQEKITI